jgi:hypothetical protein
MFNGRVAADALCAGGGEHFPTIDVTKALSQSQTLLYDTSLNGTGADAWRFRVESWPTKPGDDDVMLIQRYCY